MTEIDSQLDDLKSLVIMAVDDEPTVIEVLETFLEGEGYTNLVNTTDSRRALELLKAENADVLLLDLNMPHIGGFEILKSIRSDKELQHTPVIILTSSTDAETMLKALELGATDFLGKPVDPSELALRLRNTLSAKRYLDRLALYDGVTGLPNQRLFTERAGRAAQSARRKGKPCALLHVKLDQFQRINDTLGHRVGDALLQAAAQRLEECIRSGDLIGAPSAPSRGTLSRVGSDDFALFLPMVHSAELAARAARRIISRLAEPLRLEGNDLFVTGSVGIALFPGDGEEIDELLRHARLCNAKQTGQRAYSFYSQSLDDESVERLSLENQLRTALDRNEIMLHYQPQLDSSGRIVGTEALMRWQHPQLGSIPPGRFIPIAEETGLIGSLGKWALHTACRQASAWQKAGLGPTRMAVNVSGHQFHGGDLMETVMSALQRNGLEAQYLVLELTEGTLMENPREASRILTQMREIDVGLSVDDFGTGYSALSHLKRFRFNELKIDRSFVTDIPQDAEVSAIVTAIIAMAHNLGLRVVAEGVETREQLAFLRGRGCDEYQGFFFSKPVPPAECAARMRARLVESPTSIEK
jgi:diguanylate cyclase (GGDEF)-like protein